MAKQLTPSEEMELIRLKLNRFTLEPKVSKWLDTGSEEINSVLGTKLKGIPWGRLIELFGNESNGKSVLALYLMAIAQEQGARVIWFDAENSYSRSWFKTWGINTKELYLIQPYLGFFNGTKPKYDKKNKLISEPEISSAEVMVDDLRALIKKLYKKDSDTPIFLVVDSLTALESQYEMDVGMEGSNMKSGLALASFLSKWMKKMVSLCQTHSCTTIFINQLRLAPKAFGNPEYTPGGKAAKFYCHVRARVGRKDSKKSRIMDGKDQIGINGLLKCIKSKVGGRENTMCSYKFLFDGRAKFGLASNAEKDDE